MTFEKINNEQDKLVSEFVKQINTHIFEMLKEVEKINTKANVIFKFVLYNI